MAKLSSDPKLKPSSKAIANLTFALNNKLNRQTNLPSPLGKKEGRFDLATVRSCEEESGRRQNRQLHPDLTDRRINISRFDDMNLPEQDRSDEQLRTDLTEQEVFGKLTAKQAKYVRCWITGDYTKSEAYCEAYGKKRTDQNKQSIAASATRCHSSVNVQLAIQWLVSKENRTALMTRHEKRLFLAGVVRASTQLGKKLNPSDPLAKLDPLSAIKIDNEMAGDNQPTSIDATVTLAGIISNLSATASPLVKQAVGSVPIRSASGAFGQLPSGQDEDEAVQLGRQRLPALAGPFTS